MQLVFMQLGARDTLQAELCCEADTHKTVF